MLRRKEVRGAALAAIIATCAAAPALAGNGLYVGATVGTSIFHADKSDFDTAVRDAFDETGIAVISGTSTLDKSSVNFSGVIGYQFIRELAVEASYTDLGKLRYHASDVLASRINAHTDLDARAKGPTVAVIGALPLSKEWEIYARLGIIVSKVTLEAQATLSSSAGTVTGAPSSQSSNSVDALAGVGLAWNPNKHVKLRAEYIRYGKVGDEDTTGEINIDTFNAGLTYSF